MGWRIAAALPCIAALTIAGPLARRSAAQTALQSSFGYLDFPAEARIEDKFLAVPDARIAGEDLKDLSAAPHLAATPEDFRTAEYVARKFRAAGLVTEIVPYRVLLNQPRKVQVEAYDSSGHLLMSGPTREHVANDPYQDDPRIVMPFHGESPSGDVSGEIVYANYGRPEDFDELAERHMDLHGKIVLCRYGINFRGVKAFLAEQRGAVGILIYSDPSDDGAGKGETWPTGPWRPESAVQRGSVQYLFRYSGDPETPGIASTPDLPDSARVSPFGGQPHIVSIPLSAHDAEPILQALQGPLAPHEWQGGFSFHYHLGSSGVRAHLVSEQDDQRRLIWDVIGKLPGAQDPESMVVVGNHRDAWVYGAADPVSGTAAMLEAVRGVGALLHQGWHPRRTILFCSWDAEEEGLVGSTEWVEQQGHALDHAVAYFNTDVGVSGSDFTASAVPSLQQFVRAVAGSVPSPLGGTVLQQWHIRDLGTGRDLSGDANSIESVRIGNLGSGSDYTPFLQHAGVPSTDVGSSGPYGVYHSAFDNYAWFTQFADPHFLYVQQMARVLGLEAIRMADADVLPLDYEAYAREIAAYLAAAHKNAQDNGLSALDFRAANESAARFAAEAQRVHALQSAPSGNFSRLNEALRQAETALLSPAGLPDRPWYKHTIYAPGELNGYSAVVLPGVNEAIAARNPALAARQLDVLALALDRAAAALAGAR